MNTEAARFNMVEQQIRTWNVLDPNVLAACENVRRECFVPEAFKNLAFSDTEIEIGFKEKMITPKICARAAQALLIAKTDLVLEIGTGSGYMSAILSSLGDNVVTYEINAKLAQLAQKNINDAQIVNCVVRTDDGLKVDLDVYDVIMLTGSLSCRSLHLERHLTIGGRLFCVVGKTPSMQATLVTRTAKDAWTAECLFETELMPLTGAEHTKKFKF